MKPLNLFSLLESMADDLKEVDLLRTIENNKVRSKSYQEIYHISKRLGQDMISHGLTKTNVALISEFSEDWIISFFALFYAKNTVIPMDGNLSADTIIKYLHDVESHTVFISSIIFEKNKEQFFQCEDLCFILFDQEIVWSEDYVNSPNWEMQNALIVFTSGATSKPKAVVLTHENILSDIEYCCDLMKTMVLRGDSVLSVLPPFHMFQITAGLLTPMRLGITICYNDIKQIQTSISMFTPATIIAVPAILEGFTRKIKFLLKQQAINSATDLFGGRLKAFICGGAPLDVKIQNQYMEWGIEILEGYGMTECSPVILCNEYKKSRIGSVGRIDEQTHCVIKLVNHEICVSGSIVFPKYYKGKATEEWFQTGDLGYIDEDNYLFITGRKKNIIVLSDGNNISPEQVETILCSNRYIADAIVALNVEKGKQILTARVIPENVVLKEEELQEFIEKEINEINKTMLPYMRIHKVVIEHEIEKTILGKKRR